jgi:hypothetical protein
VFSTGAPHPLIDDGLMPAPNEGSTSAATGTIRRDSGEQSVDGHAEESSRRYAW